MLGANERAHQAPPTVCYEYVEAHLGELAEPVLDVKGLARAQGDHLAGRGKPAADLRRDRLRRQQDGAIPQRGMLEIQVAGGGQQDQPWLNAETERLPQGCKLSREVGKYVSRRPQ